jgi:hypothetical protein
MTTTHYASDRTGLLFVDPYNDFLSEGDSNPDKSMKKHADD